MSKFGSKSTNFGYYAYIDDNNNLVIGEERWRDGGIFILVLLLGIQQLGIMLKLIVMIKRGMKVMTSFLIQSGQNQSM